MKADIVSESLRSASPTKLATAHIAAMSDSDLLDLKSLISSELGQLQQRIQALKSNNERVKNELRRRREGGREVGAMIISDHAVVRYLERHKSIDVQAVREEIRTIAKRSKYEREEKRAAERLTDEQTGMRMVYSRERNSIATILSPEVEGPT